jgi:ATP/maltotriose-dependent transcriptional regulator MalT
VLRKVGIKKQRGAKDNLATGTATRTSRVSSSSTLSGKQAAAAEEEEIFEEVPADWKHQLTKMLLKDTNTMKHKRFYKVEAPLTRGKLCALSVAERQRVCVCRCRWRHVRARPTPRPRT